MWQYWTVHASDDTLFTVLAGRQGWSNSGLYTPQMTHCLLCSRVGRDVAVVDCTRDLDDTLCTVLAGRQGWGSSGLYTPQMTHCVLCSWVGRDVAIVDCTLDL